MTTLYTVGHSNHTLDEFLEILKAHGITQVVDIRSIPKSQFVPWFNKEALSKALKLNKIKYQHFAPLGGRRSTSKASINQGWKNASFRGFADYMQTDAFYAGLFALNKLLKGQKTAIMCAEAVPWRCHRSLIADAEIVRGVKVLDILSKTNLRKHELTGFAVVNKKVKPIQIYYPAENFELPLK